MDQHYEQWSTLAPRGLMIIGLGATLLAHSSSLKTRRKPFWQWFIMGTISLIVFNSGIAIFGEAVKHRAMYESKLGL
ncbi:MAG: hypothetical protein KJ065_09070 [Anaerolineae bacterium]|nr:hypothetical protein [Anaerolineae bacterium]